MFQLFKNFSENFERYMTNAGRSEARRVLLTQSDRQLEDMGISRHLLVQGIHTWPWREGEVVAKTAAVEETVTAAQKRKAEKRAIRELRSMSNAELHDMGITRGSIVDAVRYGRRDDEYRVPRRFQKDSEAAA